MSARVAGGALQLGVCVQMPQEHLVAALQRQGQGEHAKTSKYRGLRWDARTNKWNVILPPQGEQKYVFLGRFESAQEAARVFDEARVERLRLKAAETNFPLTDYLHLLSACPPRSALLTFAATTTSMQCAQSHVHTCFTCNACGSLSGA